jgi:hypothetical protein
MPGGTRTLGPSSSGWGVGWRGTAVALVLVAGTLWLLGVPGALLRAGSVVPATSARVERERARALLRAHPPPLKVSETVRCAVTYSSVRQEAELRACVAAVRAKAHRR